MNVNYRLDVYKSTITLYLLVFNIVYNIEMIININIYIDMKILLCYILRNFKPDDNLRVKYINLEKTRGYTNLIN